MNPTIFHLGISAPPSLNTNININHTAVIDVIYNSNIDPLEISEFMRVIPALLILSQNGVRGLKRWMYYHKLDNKYFNKVKFWTVGDRTHACLLKELNINSTFPKMMTGSGAVLMLQTSSVSNVLLISGAELSDDFVSTLSVSGLNYFHFPVYKIQIIKNKSLMLTFENISDNYIVFTSPSTVDGLLHTLAWSDLRALNARCISIGPTTSQCIRDYRGEIFIESKTPNVANLYSQLSELIV